jgi:hypothetical protein
VRIVVPNGAGTTVQDPSSRESGRKTGVRSATLARYEQSNENQSKRKGKSKSENENENKKALV